jgi:predicted metal-dependent HD superfamily phosphohydrolase
MRPLTAADLAPGTLVQHWKGGLYRIEALAVREADGQADVVYRPLADPARRAWTRPLDSFVETVSALNGDLRPRFVPVPLPDDQALRAAAATAGIGADLVDATLARYAEPQRHYHASWHVHDVFARAAARGLSLTRAQVLALLFHDAIYVAGAKAGSNEALSALLLRQAAYERADLPDNEVERACAMICDTAGHVPSSAESAVVIALDLATLGDPPARFDTWTELVWLEYRHLFAGEADPRRAFIARRVRVLDALQQAMRGRPVHEPAFDAAFDAAFASNVERLARHTPH